MPPLPQPSPVTITLADAVRRALAGNPGLEAVQLGVSGAQARARQAAVLPNPEVEVEVVGNVAVSV